MRTGIGTAAFGGRCHGSVFSREAGKVADGRVEHKQKGRDAASLMLRSLISRMIKRELLAGTAIDNGWSFPVLWPPLFSMDCVCE
jgi:hypothetical protein